MVKGTKGGEDDPLPIPSPFHNLNLYTGQLFYHVKKAAKPNTSPLYVENHHGRLKCFFSPDT